MRALRLGFATAALRGRRWLAGATIVNMRVMVGRCGAHGRSWRMATRPADRMFDRPGAGRGFGGARSPAVADRRYRGVIARWRGGSQSGFEF